MSRLSLFVDGVKKLAKEGDEWATGVLRTIGAKGNKNVTVGKEFTMKERGRGRGFNIKDPKAPGGSRMARGEKSALKNKLKNEQKALTKSGALKTGGAAAITIPLVEGGRRLLSDDEKKDTKQKTGLKESGKGSGKSSGKGSGKSTGAKTESKTFRERRLARMKKRLEAAENEGRKRRLKRRITRVEGRIEDAEDRRKPKKKNMGGMMKSKMASKGGKMGGKMARGMKAGGMAKKGYSKGGVAKQGANDRLDESLGMRRGKESTKSQSMKSRRDESRGSSKKSTPQSAGVAKRGWGAVMK